MNRRHFLRHAAAIGAGAALSQLSMLSARAQTADDYKALVCIFLFGGNDGNNTVVPIDTNGYAGYAAARGTIALAQNSLLPLVASDGTADFGLHPSLGAANGLQAMWNAKQLAIVANVGTLVTPLTQAQYLSTTSAKPEALFSHLDQQLQWQASISSAPSSTGWGGRLADQLASLNAGASLPTMISTAGNNLFVTGSATQALGIPVSGTFGLSGFGSSSPAVARMTALQALLGVDRGTALTDAAQDVMTAAIQSSGLLNPILTSTTSTVGSYFSGLSSGIAAELLAIAKVIEARSSLGMNRQIFMASLGSFDTHQNELNTQSTLFAQLGPAIKAFHDSMSAIGAANQVTSFTLSDFSRTLIANTNGGTDHAWGSNHFVAGGAVKGGQMYGTWPTLVIGGPDDAGNQGRWIPTSSVDQYAATLASWFGVSASGLSSVLPNLSAFPTASLGFI
jgi:uncharacterized protein (DUF1501 family)